MYNLRTRTIVESINVVFDDFADLKKKTAEDDVNDLLDNSGNIDVVKRVLPTPPTTPPTENPDSKVEKPTDENTDESSEVNEAGKNIPSKIQKNHPTSQVIGDVYGYLQTRRKEKVDYRKMAGLLCMSSTYSQICLDQDLESCAYKKTF
ncbi:uncharacterized protein [Henckelia pumila]|uniref:uncharacterized protein n=1 Tax=Henckelia pumila TaxID=405737 RepID=UPI003C6DBFDD